MRIKTNHEFSGVPKGTMGIAVRDGELWKITWDNIKRMGLVGGRFAKKNLEDWFSDKEFKQYLEIVVL